MANLQSSGAISIGDIKNLFGGPAAPSLANYYRGGAYIPATKAVYNYAREPASGESFQYLHTCWLLSSSASSIYWGGSKLGETVPNATSWSYGGWTYYKGSLKRVSDGFAIYRDTSWYTYPAINTGIPASGQISLSQFYGAEKP